MTVEVLDIDVANLPAPPPSMHSFIRALSGPVEVERRSQPRRLIVTTVGVVPLDDAFEPIGESFHAVTRDISTSGLGMLHSKPVTAKYLRVLIPVEGRDEPVDVVMEVQRCDVMGFYYDIGGPLVKRFDER